MINTHLNNYRETIYEIVKGKPGFGDGAMIEAEMTARDL